MSADDPWATATPEPEQPAPAPAQNAAVGTVKAETSGDEITLTFKESGGYDASWIVIRAASVAAANKILDEHVALQALMDKVKKVASFYRGGSPSSGGNGGGRAPQGATEPPAWAPEKPYADFVYKSGVTKTGRNAGKTWHAWMPPSKDDARKAEFFNEP